MGPQLAVLEARSQGWARAPPPSVKGRSRSAPRGGPAPRRRPVQTLAPIPDAPPGARGDAHGGAAGGGGTTPKGGDRPGARQRQRGAAPRAERAQSTDSRASGVGARAREAGAACTQVGTPLTWSCNWAVTGMTAWWATGNWPCQAHHWAAQAWQGCLCHMLAGWSEAWHGRGAALLCIAGPAQRARAQQQPRQQPRAAAGQRRVALRQRRAGPPSRSALTCLCMLYRLLSVMCFQCANACLRPAILQRLRAGACCPE